MQSPRNAFTLAEVLIALGLLGVIAAFSIPKVLTAVGNQEYNAKAKEAVGMMSDMYYTAKLNNKLVSSQTLMTSLIKNNLNAQPDNSAMVDGYYNSAPNSYSCADVALRNCYRLPNGAVLFIGRYHYYVKAPNANGTNSSGSYNALVFAIDPDGKLTSNSLTGPGKAIGFVIYNDGRILSREKQQGLIRLYYDEGSVIDYNASPDPDWYQN